LTFADSVANETDWSNKANKICRLSIFVYAPFLSLEQKNRPSRRPYKTSDCFCAIRAPARENFAHDGQTRPRLSIKERGITVAAQCLDFSDI